MHSLRADVIFRGNQQLLSRCHRRVCNGLGLGCPPKSHGPLGGDWLTGELCLLGECAGGR